MGLISTQYYPPPYSSGKPLTVRNPNGVVKLGDCIYLLNDNHGEVVIKSYMNSNFITVQAYPGHTPILTNLSMVWYILLGKGLQADVITQNHTFISIN